MNAPKFYTSKTVANLKEPPLVRIPTGINEIDNRIIGLNKGEVSVVSGSRHSAKSTILSQIALNVINSGYKVALFSGELKATKVMQWMYLQAAGRHYTKATQHEHFYTVPEDVKSKITDWMEQKLFIYNNDYGKKAQTILNAVEECIVLKKVDLLILDNLMSIDLDSTTFTKNDAQSSFIQAIIDFSRKHDVHIILVAHPRKAMGFLRIDDISGTADLSNAADNVFIVHRVSLDFKRLSKLTLGLKDDNEIYSYDNAIEICKNRDLGYQDEMIGLYFEIESKRMSCYKENNRIYGWVNHADNNIEIDNTVQSPFDLE